MKSLAELAAMRESARNQTARRDAAPGIQIVVGMGTCGIAAGAGATIKTIQEEVAKRNLDVTVTQIGCIGNCEQEPLVDVYIPGKGKYTYARVNADRARQIVANHIVNGAAIGEWVIANH